jgi:bromodomain and PHD finger-containing protein 1
MAKIDTKRFGLQCIICGRKNCGACIQCQYSKCMISFHIECARRANYFLEVDRSDKERTYRVFCEKHRPLKIVKELEERDHQTIEEVTKFAKVIDKAFEIE